MPSANAPVVMDAIVAAARRIVEVRRSLIPDSLLEKSLPSATADRGRFELALRTAPVPRVIAECKRRSPSRGVLRREYDAAQLARGYDAAGAAAVSVLTEPTFFDGAPEHLRAVRAAVALPLLRKDFIIDRYQLLEARAWGADAVLLIAGALDSDELASLIRDAEALSLDALVEVHEEAELRRAIDAGARIIGVNNRNLRTLTVNTSVSERLIDRVPDEDVAVAESGIRTGEDISRLSALGYDGFLVGELLMMAPEPASALGELIASAQHAAGQSRSAPQDRQRLPQEAAREDGP
jgi:indole-3-glycerol phosphate synthase